jgi:hypothetical protein
MKSPAALVKSTADRLGPTGLLAAFAADGLTTELAVAVNRLR